MLLNIIEMCVLIVCTVLSETFLILRRIERDMILKKCKCIYVNYPLFLSDFNPNWIFSTYFSKNLQRPVASSLHPHAPCFNPFCGNVRRVCNRKYWQELVSGLRLFQAFYFYSSFTDGNVYYLTNLRQIFAMDILFHCDFILWFHRQRVRELQVEGSVDK